MLTPVDIENKEFTKAFRGYDISEVEDFMKTLVADYEKLYRENNELKEKNAGLNETLASYKGMEETMQNAILVAQRTAEDIKQNAYERAETIVKDAERRASEAINNANRSITTLEKTYLNMQREMNGFKAKMSSLLSTYMQLLTELPEQKAQANAPAVAPVEEPIAPKAPVPDAPAPQPDATPEADPADGNTNTFSISAVKKEMEASEEPAPQAGPVEISVKQTVGLTPERKLNPVVEEILRKKREEQKQVEAKDESAEASAPAEAPEAQPFAVTKETIQKEPSATVSEINLENLKAFDVFSDDTL